MKFMNTIRKVRIRSTAPATYMSRSMKDLSSSSPSSGKARDERHDRQFGEDPVDVEPDGRDHRVDREARGILEQQLPLGQTAGARRGDRELVELVEHGGAHGLKLECGGGPGEHDRRDPEMGEQVDNFVDAPGRFLILRRKETTNRRAEELHTHIEHEQGKHEVRQCQPEIADNRKRIVCDGLPSYRGVDSDRNRDGVCQQQRREQEGKCKPDALADDFVDRCFEGIGLAEIASGDDTANPAQVAFMGWPIESEARANVLHVRFR